MVHYSSSQHSPSTLKKVLPNFVTSIGLSMGLLALFMAAWGKPLEGAWLLLLCVLLDKLDGTVARLLNATSELGVQLDSLSDFLTFCIAPAVVILSLFRAPDGGFGQFPEVLLPVASLVTYVVAGALRLARFNCQSAEEGAPRHYFVGIPTTLCGGFLMSLVLTLDRMNLMSQSLPYLLALPPICGLLMMSQLYLPKLNKRRKFRIITWFQVFNLLAVPVLVIQHWAPEYMLFLTLLYLVVGTVWSNRRGVVID